jgi:hypothetical protein
MSSKKFVAIIELLTLLNIHTCAICISVKFLFYLQKGDNKDSVLKKEGWLNDKIAKKQDVLNVYFFIILY